MKVLLVGQPGVGKTTWMSTAPDIGVAACETGWGSGLLSCATKGIEYVEPANMAELEAFCKGQVFPKKATVGLDSLTAMTRTYIKDHALTFPRKGPESPKRKAGVPELDDYGTIGELTRRLLVLLSDQDRHVIATTTTRSEKDDQGIILSQGPDLPGQLYLGAPAMFDFVFFMKTRKRLRIPGDKRSEYTEHYFITQNDGMHIAKCRSVIDDSSLLPPEIIFDRQAGTGSFPAVLKMILDAYAVKGAA